MDIQTVLTFLDSAVTGISHCRIYIADQFVHSPQTCTSIIVLATTAVRTQGIAHSWNNVYAPVLSGESGSYRVLFYFCTSINKQHQFLQAFERRGYVAKTPPPPRAPKSVPYLPLQWDSRRPLRSDFGVEAHRGRLCGITTLSAVSNEIYLRLVTVP